MKKVVFYFIGYGALVSLLPILFYWVLSFSDDFNQDTFGFFIFITLIILLSFLSALLYILFNKKKQKKNQFGVIYFIPLFVYSFLFLIFVIYLQSKGIDTGRPKEITVFELYILLLLNIGIPLLIISFILVKMAKKTEKLFTHN